MIIKKWYKTEELKKIVSSIKQVYQEQKPHTHTHNVHICKFAAVQNQITNQTCVLQWSEFYADEKHTTHCTDGPNDLSCKAQQWYAKQQVLSDGTDAP